MMSRKHKSVQFAVVDDQTIAEIIRSPDLEPDIPATFSPDLLVKRHKHKTLRHGSSDSIGEQNNSNDSTVPEGHPGESPMLPETCEEAAVESQTPDCVTVKSTKKKARAARISTEQQQDCVEVYIGKFTAAETSPVNNAVDMDLADDHLLVLNSKNGAIEEEIIENGDAVMINNVLESEFFKVTCSEVHQDKADKDKQHDGPSSEDYFLCNEQTQEGTERQDQIHEGDDQMVAGSDHPDDSAAEVLSLDGKAATHSSDALEFGEMPPEESACTDLIEESEGYAKDLDCPECASTTGSYVAPEGSLDGDLLESEQIEEKLQPFDSNPCLPASQDNSHGLDLACEEFSHTDLAYADSGFKAVGEMCIVRADFPFGSLEVAEECEVLTGDAEPSSSLLSPHVSPEVEKSRSTSTTSKRGSMKRKIKAPVRLERSPEMVNSENVGPRQAIAKSERHPRVSVSPKVDKSKSTSTTRKQGSVRRKIKAPVRLESPSAETVNFENVGPRQAVAKSKRRPRASVSPEVEKNRSTSTTRKQGSVRRKIKAPVRLESPSAETVNSENVGPRQTVAKSERHSRAKLTVEDSSACPQAEATVIASTPRTATKRKVILEQTLSSEHVVTEESSDSGKNKLTGDQTDRPVPAEKSESAVAKTSWAVVKRKSKCDPAGRAKPASTDVTVSGMKSLSVLIEKWQPVAKRKYISSQARQAKAFKPVTSQKSLSKPVSSSESLSKPVSSSEYLSTPVSSERSLSKTVSLGHCELLDKPLSAVKVKSKSDRAKNLSDPPVVEQPGSVNRSRIPLKRTAKTLDGPADASQMGCVENVLTRKSEPALKRKSRISSGTDNDSHKERSETVSNFDRLVPKPCDSECLSVDVASSVPDTAHASQNIISSAKQKPTEAIVIPPPGYVSFSHTGDMEISEVILNAIPQLVENGSSQVYLLLKNVTLPSSYRQESLVFAADLSSTPYKFVQTSSLPNKNSAQGMLADKISEPQVAKKILGPQKSFRKQQAKKQTTQRPSPLDNSSALEAEDPTLPMNVDITSSTGQLVMPAASDQLTSATVVKWTPVHTSAWLVEHGLDRLLPNFSCMDGLSLMEMAHYFSKDSEVISKYLQDMGLLFIDELKLFAALRTIPTQTCDNTSSSLVEASQAGAAAQSSQVAEVTETAAPIPRKRGRPPKSVKGSGGNFNHHDVPSNNTSSSSVEVSQAGAAAQSSQVAEVTEMAAPAPRKRGRPPKSVRGPGGTNSLPASGGEVRASAVSIPIKQWTYQDVSAWLTSQGLARLLPEFVQFDGQGMSELVHLFNTDVRTVHRRLYNMDFTLFESLVFCAGLRTLSQRQDEMGLRVSKQ